MIGMEMLLVFILLVGDYAIGCGLWSIWGIFQDLRSFELFERILIGLLSALILGFSVEFLVYEFYFFSDLWTQITKIC
jgi:hypothetical protein